MNPMFLFDGSNLGFRAFCAFPGLTFNEEPIGAIYGVLRMLNTFIREFPPGKIVMPFDFAKSRYRKSIYPEYKQGKARVDPKQQRQKDSFKEQLPLIVEFANLYGICTLTEEVLGFEADDVIAFLCAEFNAGKYPNIDKIIIISSDKDLCALTIYPHVTWYDPIGKRMISKNNFKKEFEIEIEQYRDYKVLTGDISDNVPHPRGLGPKHAVKLLNTYGTIERMQQLSCEKLQGHDEVLRLAKDLVTLDLHTRFSSDPVWEIISKRVQEKTQVSDKILGFLEGLEFASILETFDSDLPLWKEYADVSLSCPLPQP